MQNFTLILWKLSKLQALKVHKFVQNFFFFFFSPHNFINTKDSNRIFGIKWYKNVSKRDFSDTISFLTTTYPKWLWPLKKSIFGKYERLVDIKLKGFFSLETTMYPMTLMKLLTFNFKNKITLNMFICL